MPPQVRRPSTVHAKSAKAPTLGRFRKWVVCVCLSVLIVAIYAPVKNYQFVDYDDEVLVSNNPYVQAGLTASSIRWAITTINVFYWQPLTWISFMANRQLFGRGPGAYHAVNVALHATNAILLFLLLDAFTAGFWPSAASAALFALHPLRVESVVWISERKDVLSGMFWLLTLFAYHFYLKKRVRSRYLILVAVFCLGLMAKPMLMTIPFILLILDYWPLRRWGRDSVRILIREKIPLLVLSLGSALLSFRGLQQYGATVDLPLAMRLSNAVVAYARYLKMMAWPSALSVLYPYDPRATVWRPLLSLTMLGALTVLALRLRRQSPYFLSGWLWYLVTLAPTVGIVQSGPQALADRFTYLPSIGIVIAIVWSGVELIRKERCLRKPILVVFVGSMLGFSWVSAAQVKVWRDSVTLFSQAASVGPENAIVQHNLGYGLAAEGRYAEAIPHYQEALRLDPHLEKVHYNLGRALYETGDIAGAASQFREALSSPMLADSEADVRSALGITLTRLGDPGAAATQFEGALKLKPLSPELHANWGSLLAMRGDVKRAAEEFEIAVRLDPEYTDGHINLGQALSDLGRRREALEEFKSALAQSPDNSRIRSRIEDLLRSDRSLQ